MKLLTNEEAAERLNVDVRSLKRYIVFQYDYDALIKLSPRVWRHDAEKLEQFIKRKAEKK